MTPDRYLRWVPESIAGFAAQQTASGAAPERAAREYAEREFDRLLPFGLDTPGHHLWSAFDGDEEVGYLWLAVRGTEGYVYDVAVDPALRGRGHGHAIMLAAEDAARSVGAGMLRLNVFGHNTAALNLYHRLGYSITVTELVRRLEDQPLAVVGDPVRLVVGPASEHIALTAYDGDREVGSVSLRITRAPDGLHGHGKDLRVDRVSEHGQRVLAAVESFSRARGAVALGLTVAAGDDDMRSVAEQAGYRPIARLMRKPLPPADARIGG
jgi:ribosomal protein S18 acetylase RimI-like enzyme